MTYQWAWQQWWYSGHFRTREDNVVWDHHLPNVDGKELTPHSMVWIVIGPGRVRVMVLSLYALLSGEELCKWKGGGGREEEGGREGGRGVAFS